MSCTCDYTQVEYNKMSHDLLHRVQTQHGKKNMLIVSRHFCICINKGLLGFNVFPCCRTKNCISEWHLRVIRETFTHFFRNIHIYSLTLWCIRHQVNCRTTEQQSARHSPIWQAVQKYPRLYHQTIDCKTPQFSPHIPPWNTTFLDCELMHYEVA